MNPIASVSAFNLIVQSVITDNPFEHREHVYEGDVPFNRFLSFSTYYLDDLRPGIILFSLSFPLTWFTIDPKYLCVLLPRSFRSPVHLSRDNCPITTW
ncbi:MAG TPA: hypothetical protein VMW77_07385 [Methanoregula sp.]|nr:hypothetical protein [Methanoregula sp.]